jgi:hypothetical protein
MASEPEGFYRMKIVPKPLFHFVWLGAVLGVTSMVFFCGAQEKSPVVFSAPQSSIASSSPITVSPTNLLFEFPAGDPNRPTQTLTLRSTLSYDVNWAASIKNWDFCYVLEPRSGVLPAGQSIQISFGLTGIVVGSFIRSKPSATLEVASAPSSYTFGMTSEGMVFQRNMTIRNTGFNTPGGAIYIGNMFTVTQDPGSDPALTNNWSMGFYVNDPNLTMTNNETRLCTLGASSRLVPAAFAINLVSRGT